jgi:hypothetical protein
LQAAKFRKKKPFGSLLAASLPEPDIVDFGAMRAAREEVICNVRMAKST